MIAEVEARPLQVDARPLLLIVDDDADQLFLLEQAAMRTNEFRVITATGGEDALAQMQSRLDADLPPPDLIVSDMRMPLVSGVEFLQRLKSRAEFRGTPMLIVSCSNYLRDREAVRAAGLDGYFEKPMHFSNLIGLMRSLTSFFPAPTRPGNA